MHFVVTVYMPASTEICCTEHIHNFFLIHHISHPNTPSLLGAPFICGRNPGVGKLVGKTYSYIDADANAIIRFMCKEKFSDVNIETLAQVQAVQVPISCKI